MSAGELGTAMVAARQVTKRWPGGGGLAPTDLVLHRGQVTVVRGRSGSGKSTLLSILAGWCGADSGSVQRIAGPDWASWTAIAVVPQVIGLVPELSVAENVELPLRLAGVARRERAQRTADALQELDLADLAPRLPRETSLGQQQRTAIARALVIRPVVALVDEPTSHQDAGHAAAIVAAVRRSADHGTAVLVATHDQHVIAAADSVSDLDSPGDVHA